MMPPTLHAAAFDAVGAESAAASAEPRRADEMRPTRRRRPANVSEQLRQRDCRTTQNLKA